MIFFPNLWGVREIIEVHKETTLLMLHLTKTIWSKNASWS